MQKLSEKQRLENENAALKALLSEKLLEIEQYKQQIKGNRSMIKFSVRYEQWLEEIKGQIQENTRENYISIYKNHLGPYFGDRMLDEIAPQEIERYYTTRSAMHLNIHTIHRHHANLHSFFKYAHRHDWIAENPMAKVERPKDTYKFMAAYYHADQMRALFDAAAHDKIFPAIFLCGVMGLRRSEIAGLKWDAVSFNDNTIQIRRKAIRDRSSRKDVVSTSLKTQSSYRTLVMPEPVRSFLLKLRAQHRNSDFILVDEKGQRIRLHSEGMHYIPADIGLANADIYLVMTMCREQILRRILCTPVLAGFEYILIDCNPSLGLLLTNALVASTDVIIPVQAQMFSLNGMNALTKVIEMVRSTINPGLSINGILPTMVDKTNMSRAVVEALQVDYNEYLYKTTISRRVEAANATALSKSSVSIQGSQIGSEYLQLANEVIERGC